VFHQLVNIVIDHSTNISSIFKLGKLVLIKSNKKIWIELRWRDNDVYGHVNNVVYGEWIDTIVNKYLIEKCLFEPLKSPLIGFVVCSSCEYYSPISYPSIISVGLFINKIGKSSVDYKVGIFETNQSIKASAVGGFTHVFVSRTTHRPHPIDQTFRKELLSISNLIDSE
jgi:acyl-CoA thioester hydrolase